MNVIFVNECFDADLAVWGKDKLEFLNEHHDPIDGVGDYLAFWGENKPRSISIDRSEMQPAFWDHRDMLKKLRAICDEDVYLQCAHSHMKMVFLLAEDAETVERHIAENRPVAFPPEMLDDIVVWLTIELGLHVGVDFSRRYTNDRPFPPPPAGMGMVGAAQPPRWSAFAFRDPSVAMLAKVKFPRA